MYLKVALVFEDHGVHDHLPTLEDIAGSNTEIYHLEEKFSDGSLFVSECGQFVGCE
jgi:hypothetical protein